MKFGLSVVLGIAIGAAFGAAMHNVAVGTALGAGAGCLPALLAYLKRPACPVPKDKP